jgi:hypothetical protein
MPPDGATKGALDAVNALRHRYGAKAVEWDDQLYAGARTYAQTLARDDATDLPHAPNPTFCENLAMSHVGDRMYDAALVESVRTWWASTPENNWRGEESIYFDQPDAPWVEWGHFGKLTAPALYSLCVGHVR